MLPLLLALFVSNPPRLETIRFEYVDLIELSHQHDDRGCHVFDQVILWERSPADGRFRVRAWFLLKENYPIRENGLCRVRFEDGKKIYEVRSKLYRESWNHLDPEREDAKRHPQDSRIGLPKQ